MTPPQVFAPLLLSVLLASTVASFADTSFADTSMTRAEYFRGLQEREKRMRQIQQRARELRPQRRDHPLRYQNISDREVREIQLAARGLVPRAIVNISGVVTGCPCEEGLECTDQVWIVATRPELSVELQLSRIGGAWTIGPIQQFWLSMADLKANEQRFASSYDYDSAVSRLWDAFPRCSAPAKTPTPTTIARTPGTR